MTLLVLRWATGPLPKARTTSLPVGGERHILPADSKTSKGAGEHASDSIETKALETQHWLELIDG